MFRVCKLTISALEATLLHFINDTYTESIPFYRMLCMDLKTLESRAGTLMGKIKDIKDLDVKLIDDVSYVGSGSLPDEGIPTKVVSISLNKKLLNKASIEKIALNLRLKVPSVFCRVNKDSLCFDMRTLFDGEEIKIAERLKEAIKDVRI